jgi:hypothetical protein
VSSIINDFVELHNVPEVTCDTKSVVEYTPGRLSNLSLTDEHESLSPILDMKAADLTREDIPQLYCVNGF